MKLKKIVLLGALTMASLPFLASATPDPIAPIEDSITATAPVLPATIGYNPLLIQYIEEVTLNTGFPNGWNSYTQLEAGTTYLLTARGTYFTNGSREVADAECSRPTAPASQLENRALGNLWQDRRGTIGTPSDDKWDVYVNGTPVQWNPLRSPISDGGLTRGAVNRCDDASHVYTVVFTPPTTGVANFKIMDDYYADNQGYLFIGITQLHPPKTGTRLLDTITVNSSSSAGAESSIVFQPDQVYMAVATGSYSYDTRDSLAIADAECVQSETPGYSRRSRDRTLPVRDLYDLLVDGTSVEWIADGQTDSLCSPSSHSYRYTFKVDSAHKINFAVDDIYHADNSGSLTVSIYGFGAEQ